jgi:hypothetical protein
MLMWWRSCRTILALQFTFFFSSSAKKTRTSVGLGGGFFILLPKFNVFVVTVEGWHQPLDDNFVNKFSNDPASCEPISDHLPLSLSGSHGVTGLS